MKRTIKSNYSRGLLLHKTSDLWSTNTDMGMGTGTSTGMT